MCIGSAHLNRWAPFFTQQRIKEGQLSLMEFKVVTKVLWFSRHDMDTDQRSALERKHGEIAVTKVNGTIQNVHVPFEAVVDNAEESVTLPAFKTLVPDFDVIAVVAPIGLQQQIVGVAGDRPVLIVKNERPLDGVAKTDATFVFLRWERIIKIDVVTENYAE